jgi:hypothetical protein
MVQGVSAGYRRQASVCVARGVEAASRAPGPPRLGARLSSASSSPVAVAEAGASPLLQLSRELQDATDVGPRFVQITPERVAAVQGRRIRWRRKDKMGLAPILDWRVHRPQDAFVRGDPLRNWLQGTGAWIETTGLLEAVDRHDLWLPLGAGVRAEGGFDQKALLQYRCILPYTLGRDTPAQVVGHNALRPPTTAARAARMPRGGLFGLRGVAQVVGHGGIVGGPLARWGGVSLGAGVVAEVTAKWRGELGIEVLRLDGDLVRVTLSRERGITETLTAELRAGLMGHHALGSVWGKSLVARALRRGAPALLGLVQKWGASVAGAGVSHATTGVDRTTYTFDLSVPAAAQAYDALLKLRVSEADALALMSQGGTATGVTSSDRLLVNDSAAERAMLRVLGGKLLLWEHLRLETRGVLRDAAGRRLLVRKAVSRRRYGSLFSGTQDIRWEVVQVRAPDGAYTPYYRLLYDQKRRISMPELVEFYFRLAEALGNWRAACKRASAEEALAKLREMPWARKLFSHKDDIHTHVDVYFTAEGIERLGRVNELEALAAYARAMSVLDVARAGHPLAEEGAKSAEIVAQLDAVARLDGMWWWTLRQRREATALAARYRHRFGRDVHRDATLLTAGRACWRHFARWQGWPVPTEPEARATLISRCFIELGEALGTHFAPAAATLARLAGPHGTVVRKLSLSGAGLAIRGSEAQGLPDPTDLPLAVPAGTAPGVPLTPIVIWA